MSRDILRPNTGLYCTYKRVKNEVFPKALIASFWLLLTHLGMIFDKIGHVWATWWRFLVSHMLIWGLVSGHSDTYSLSKDKRDRNELFFYFCIPYPHCATFELFSRFLESSKHTLSLAWPYQLFLGPIWWNSAQWNKELSENGKNGVIIFFFS